MLTDQLYLKPLHANTEMGTCTVQLDVHLCSSCTNRFMLRTQMYMRIRVPSLIGADQTDQTEAPEGEAIKQEQRRSGRLCGGPEGPQFERAKRDSALRIVSSRGFCVEKPVRVMVFIQIPYAKQQVRCVCCSGGRVFHCFPHCLTLCYSCSVCV